MPLHAGLAVFQGFAGITVMTQTTDNVSNVPPNSSQAASWRNLKPTGLPGCITLGHPYESGYGQSMARDQQGQGI